MGPVLSSGITTLPKHGPVRARKRASGPTVSMEAVQPFGNLATRRNPGGIATGPWLCVPALRRVCRCRGGSVLSGLIPQIGDSSGVQASLSVSTSHRLLEKLGRKSSLVKQQLRSERGSSRTVGGEPADTGCSAAADGESHPPGIGLPRAAAKRAPVDNLRSDPMKAFASSLTVVSHNVWPNVSPNVW